MARGIGRGRGRGRGDALDPMSRIKRLPAGGLPKGLPPVPGFGPRPKVGEGLAPKVRGVGAQGKGKGQLNGKGIGLGGQALPGPGGGQLARRVQSGAITQEQADQTLQQRQTLQKAFGKDWRQKVFGDVGYVQRTRSALAKDPTNPRLAALNKKLMESRQQMLEAARKKNKGEGE